jgi:pimeloyl-ACP methyl ester carboxylesterase
VSEERWVEVDGGRLAFDVTGDGPGVVLLHGGLWDRRTWDEQIDALAQRSTVVRYDLRGFGRSSTPETPYSDLDDLAAVMDAAPLDRAALVGCSVGGLVATMFAIARPERVRALILASSGLYGHGWATGEHWARHGEEVEAAVARGDLPAAVDLDLRPWIPMGTDDPAGARLRAIAQDNARQLTVDEDLSMAPDWTSLERLGEIRVPTLVLDGDRDVPEFREIARLLAERIAGARLVTIPDADHVVHVRQPAGFNRAVADFLAAV